MFPISHFKKEVDYGKSLKILQAMWKAQHERIEEENKKTAGQYDALPVDSINRYEETRLMDQEKR